MTSPAIENTTTEHLADALAQAGAQAVAKRPVVVGVDVHQGELSTGSTAAVEWAAAEADARGVQLHVVSVFEWLAVPAWSGRADDLIISELRHNSTRAVASAIDTARTSAPNVAVSGEVLRGETEQVLDILGARAGVLVVGTRHLAILGRAALGSVSGLVASSAPCPVVVLCGPAGSSAERVAVVAGVAPDETARPVLEYAFAHADRRRLPLRIVLAANPVAADAHEVEVKAMRWLGEAVAGCRGEHPDVEVHAAVEIDRTVDALIGASVGQHILVVGRHASRKHPGFHLGSVSQRVLHYASCPVAIIPSDTAPALS